MLQQMFDFPPEKHLFPRNRRVDIDKKRKNIFILSFFVLFFLPTTEAYRTCWDLSKKAFFQNKKLKNFEKNFFFLFEKFWKNFEIEKKRMFGIRNVLVASH